MSNKAKVWIISEYYYPIVTSTGYYITEIAEYLAKENNNIHVFCTNAKYNEINNIVVPKSECRNGVHIHRVLTGNIDKNSFINRIIRLLYSSVSLFINILFAVNKNDKLLIVTNPAFLILLMPIVRLIKGVKYTILVHDIFPENLVAIGKIKDNSIVYKFLKKLYDFAYSKADRCIAIGRDMQSVLKDKIGSSSKICVIPNWSDVDEVFSIEKEKTRMINSLNLKNKFVFQFAGNLGFAQGIDNIINAIKLIKNENIHFLFIGSGAMEDAIVNFVKSNPLKNVSHVGFQNRNEQVDFLNACDVAIITLSDGMLGLGVPSKAYNIMATGKPILIIAHEKSEISRCVSEFNLGWVVQPNNPIMLSQVFDTIYTEFSVNKNFNLKNSREVAIEHFSKNRILKEIRDLFQE
jgi:glycosyltransferase involved in cell wall biosynthesis